MRKVFLAGATLAVVFVVVDCAGVSLNQPDDLAVAAGCFMLLALVSAGVGIESWLGRRVCSVCGYSRRARFSRADRPRLVPGLRELY